MQNGAGIFYILLFLSIIALYFLPTIIAVKRGHEYRWVIFALNLAGGWTGVLWIAALVWAVFPHNRTVIDPVVGSATGVGFRNTGDTLGEADFGRQRGYSEEQSRNEERLRFVPSSMSAHSPAIDVDAIDALERLHKLKEGGVLTADEFETQKRKIIG
jgi:hypothetical protein